MPHSYYTVLNKKKQARWNIMDQKKLKSLILSAMMAALVCAATMAIQIPSPTNGYVNLGDCFVLLCGFILNPWSAFAAAGIGSALADLLSGYPHYAVATFLIKGCVALCASFGNHYDLRVLRIFRPHSRQRTCRSGQHSGKHRSSSLRRGLLLHFNPTDQSISFIGTLL